MIKKIFSVLLTWGLLGLIASWVYLSSFTPAGKTVQRIYTNCGGTNPYKTNCAAISQADLININTRAKKTMATFIGIGWVIGGTWNFVSKKRSSTSTD